MRGVEQNEIIREDSPEFLSPYSWVNNSQERIVLIHKSGREEKLQWNLYKNKEEEGEEEEL